MRGFATELRALRWSAVDLAAGGIRVTEAWDPAEGAIAPKTKNSHRTTPLPGLLRDYHGAPDRGGWASGRRPCLRG